MRAPSSQVQPHTCTITYNTWGTDVDGGRRIASTSTTNDVKCFVQPGRARTIVDTSDESGYRRVTEIVPTRIYFFQDASLKTEDMIQWVDSMRVTHSYIVRGYFEPGGLMAFWRVDCEEVV